MSSSDNPQSSVSEASEQAGAPNPSSSPVLDVRVCGIRLVLELPDRLNVLAGSLIMSSAGAALGYLFAGR
ncbi:hypothetical protein [Kitasatospora azatica]|uniref:hypothetical protein n=1 Tax=Kitasatospora azatica TaxID=58347 RepID=UPI00055CFC2E|nr:hypothetical protein [Kitasatospora azatica]